MCLYVLCGCCRYGESLQAIVLSRAGIGLAEAGIMTCCTTLMGDYYSGRRRERLFALQMVATSLSAAVFIAAGGFLGQNDWRTPFALYAVGLIFLPLMAWKLGTPRPARWLRNLRRLERPEHFRGARSPRCMHWRCWRV
jgi:MFS family permease